MKYKYQYSSSSNRSDGFWGIILILAALLLILSKLNLFSVHLGIIQIIFTLIFLTTLVRSLYRLRVPGIIFSIAFLAIIYAKPLGIASLSPWTILISAFLLNWGLSLLFHPFPNIRKYFTNHFFNFEYHDQGNHNTQDKQKTFNGDFAEVDRDQKSHDSYVKIDNNLGTVNRHVDTADFHHADIRSNMGQVNLYLNNAQMNAENGEINLNISMSDVDIYLPSDWQVIDQVEHMMDDYVDNTSSDNVSSKTIYLTGSVSFSDLTIYHI